MGPESLRVRRLPSVPCACIFKANFYSRPISWISSLPNKCPICAPYVPPLDHSHPFLGLACVVHPPSQRHPSLHDSTQVKGISSVHGQTEGRSALVYPDWGIPQAHRRPLANDNPDIKMRLADVISKNHLGLIFILPSAEPFFLSTCGTSYLSSSILLREAIQFFGGGFSLG